MRQLPDKLRTLLVAAVLCAVAGLFVPAQARGMAMLKSHCCSLTEIPAASSDECPKAPLDQEESACCQGCALGLAMLFAAPPDFVYAQTGEQTLVRLIVRSHSLPRRPPVPPPRFALS